MKTVYKLLVDHTPEGMEALVNEWCRQGWQLYGDITIMSSAGSLTFYQSIAKRV